MRALVLTFALLGSGCILEALGAYSCEEYCDGIEDKVVTCAAEEGVSWDDFAGASRDETLDACQDEIDGRELSDIQCRAETGTINNASCSEIAEMVGAY